MSTSHCEVNVNEFHHRLPVQMRFNDIDMLGHLNNSVYLTFMDLAKARYFEAVEGEVVDITSVGIVVVNINVKFFAPTSSPALFEVETALRAIWETSPAM